MGSGHKKSFTFNSDSRFSSFLTLAMSRVDRIKSRVHREERQIQESCRDPLRIPTLPYSSVALTICFHSTLPFLFFFLAVLVFRFLVFPELETIHLPPSILFSSFPLP